MNNPLPNALPRKQALKQAKRALEEARKRARQNGKAEPFIQFQFVCSYCRVVATVEQKNKLPLIAQCFRCGLVQKIEKAASLIFEVQDDIVLKKGESLPTSYPRTGRIGSSGNASGSGQG